MILIALLAVINVECNLYRFDQGSAEFWYRLPISDLIDLSDTAGIIAGTINVPFKFDFKIVNRQEQDSNIICGQKEIPLLLPLPPDEQYSVEYIPLDLYPGEFEFELTIRTVNDTGACRERTIIHDIDTGVAFSDMIIGKKSSAGNFTYRGVKFYPSAVCFNLFDTLMSYVELYGLRPDSLYFIVKYTIRDADDKMIFSTKYKRQKFDYQQVETLSVYLGHFVEGDYQIEVNIDEPVSGTVFTQKRPFTILSRIDDGLGKKYYRDIDYLVSAKEYKKFIKLSPQEQELYLKNFWQKNDYWSFEDRMSTADRLFSVRGLKGRDSYRGAYLIAYGEPDEREIIPMLQWSRQLELWHYYTMGKDILFCEMKNDGNPKLITELDVGELSRILEMGIRDKDDLDKYPWLKDIAPGTYDQKTMDDIEQ